METKTEPTLLCPKCGESIKLTESLAAPLVAATRAQYEQQLADQAKTLSGREAVACQAAGSERPAGG